LTELPKPDALAGNGGVWFSLGEHELHLGVEDDFAPARKAHPAFRLESGELDALADRLGREGMEVAWDERLPGARRFYATDPWGNRLEFLARS
jgi:hypothetical protein